VLGGFSHTDTAGPNSFHFTGHVNERKLKPGRYRLDATPRAHRSTGATVSTNFRVVRH
jgi:hypothetical protein